MQKVPLAAIAQRDSTLRQIRSLLCLNTSSLFSAMTCFERTVGSLLTDTIARLNKLSCFSLLPARQVFHLLEASSVSLALTYQRWQNHGRTSSRTQSMPFMTFSCTRKPQ